MNRINAIAPRGGAAMNHLVVLALALCATLAASCDDEVCKKGRSECLSEHLLRTCIPDIQGKDDNVWAVTQCDPDEACVNDALAGGALSVDGGAVASSEGLAACVGTCDLGASECASDVLARHCVDGRAWQLEPCDPGSRCIDGVCKLGADGGLRVCDQGQRDCASREIERQCAADGSGWVPKTCDDGEACLIDRCAPDPDASCDEPSRCLDDKTALRCLGEDKGFEVVACEGDTWCEAGRCRGNTCVLGEVCTTLNNQVRACVDGETLTDTQCATNEVCKQDRDHASCVPKTCNPGATVCGDPRDPAVDDTKFYSTCLDGTVTLSGVPEWSVTECTGLLTCDPVFAASGNPCRQECTPTAEACSTISAAGDSWVTCQDDGTWSAPERCDVGTGKRKLCAIPPDPDASVIPTHVCAEPVCAWIMENAGGEGGTCEETQINACNDEGNLTGAEACETGICRSILMIAQDDGRYPGACDTALECEEGEERCIYDGITPTPLYQSCENSLWTAQLKACTDDEICIDFLDDDGLSAKLCGADCVPGSRRCNMDGALQTCSGSGEWGSAETCNAGTCQAVGGDDAACVLDCVPDTMVCSGGAKLASDGVSVGTDSVQECDSDGVLGAPTACTGTEVCRTSRLGEALGCIECVGPSVLGGNNLGYADTRCDPMMVANVQECDTDNTWKASRACNGGKMCIGPQPQFCATCTSQAGNTVTCTQTNINDLGICGGCDHATLSAPLVSCTATAIAADINTTTEDCTDFFGDDPLNGDTSGAVSWGGVSDCCDGYDMTGLGSNGEFLLPGTTTCATLGYGAAIPWGGEVDCCSNFLGGGTGNDFAYCGN